MPKTYKKTYFVSYGVREIRGQKKMDTLGVKCPCEFRNVAEAKTPEGFLGEAKKMPANSCRTQDDEGPENRTA